MNAMVLLPYSSLFRSGFRLFLSFSDISKLSPLGRPFNPSYEIVSIPTMIVNAYPRDLVPQREYFLQIRLEIPPQGFLPLGLSPSP